VRQPHQLQRRLDADVGALHLLQRILVVRCGDDAVALPADGVAGAVGVGDVLKGESAAI